MGPWLDVSMDFCGPLLAGNCLIVIIDEFSKYPVVEITKCLTAEKIMDKVFSVFSYPRQITTAKGPLFYSQQWSDFFLTQQCESL